MPSDAMVARKRHLKEILKFAAKSKSTKLPGASPVAKSKSKSCIESKVWTVAPRSVALVNSG